MIYSGRTEKPTPEEVFTPRQPPGREMFTRRNEPDLGGDPGLQDSLRDALREKGGQLILYGDTGVGKSTLLKYAAEDEGVQLLSVECTSKRSYDGAQLPVCARKAAALTRSEYRHQPHPLYARG